MTRRSDPVVALPIAETDHGRWCGSQRPCGRIESVSQNGDDADGLCKASPDQSGVDELCVVGRSHRLWERSVQINEGHLPERFRRCSQQTVVRLAIQQYSAWSLGLSGRMGQTTMTRAASSTGRGRNSAPCTMLKTLTLTPIPVASVRTTMAVYKGLRRSRRIA